MSKYILIILFITYLSKQTFTNKVYSDPIKLDAKIENSPEKFENDVKKKSGENVRVFVITPTYKRLTRYPDLIRFANSLKLLPFIHWIVIEDGDKKSLGVSRILKRSGIKCTYFAAKTPKFVFPKRGWWQRDMAIERLIVNKSKFISKHQRGIVYFGDDDNSYDPKLFTDYVVNVQKIGVWAVGLSSSSVEAPIVKNKKVVGFDTWYAPEREHPFDFSAFALSLKYFEDNPKARLTNDPTLYPYSPEGILLQKLNINLSDLEPFESQLTNPKEIYVWHTKTQIPNYFKTVNRKEVYGYDVEL
uniref:Galactosylgalactosylxylosylprotein 3-beta-glucuronosyltransferase n=1 Tax=Rhabditophanes sp. KR3021 TaxID=114890 RepID=A0AC35UG47_9BILA